MRIIKNEEIISVPVQNHVKKYLLFHQGKDGIAEFTKNELTGMFLFTLLNKANPGKPLKYNDSFLKVKVAKLGSANRRKKLIITKEQADAFNYYVDEMIRNEFLKYVIRKNKTDNLSIDFLIRDFKLIYQFDETDWSFDAMKKYYYRNCKVFISKTPI